MAHLEHSASSERHILSSSHLVGRSHTCQLRLGNPLASAEHAVFRWGSRGWELRDLASSNGTFVNEQRLERGQTLRIEAGARIAFGDASELFVLLDDDPPAACARTANGRAVFAEAGVLALPDPDSYEFLLYEDIPGKWFIEQADGESRAVEPNELLRGVSDWWQLDLPVVVQPTRPASGMALYVNNLRLLIKVSAYKEDIEVTVVHRGGHRHLDNRASSYLLLVLARQRLQDRADGIVEDEQGWLERDALLEALDMEHPTPSRLNVEVYRMRNRFKSLGVADAEQIIERRPYSRRLRLGVGDVDILESPQPTNRRKGRP